MLKDAYEQVNIEPKKPFGNENLKQVVNEYNSRYDDSVSVEFGESIATIKKPKDPFKLINLIDIRLIRTGGYKLIDGDLTIPYISR